MKQNPYHKEAESKTTTLESSFTQQTINEDQEYLLGPQRRNDIGKKTLVLDLDETLVHSSFKPIENPDIVLPVEIEGSICNIFILVRPGVSQFLKKMHKHYELVIFTASLSKYADPLVDILDPEKMCSYKLFREHCTFHNNAFVKDLTRLGRGMKDVIILDNSPIAYMFQPENAMPILSWYDN
jgi:RNA polymerase II subunit A small phosphatase-like protein